MALLHTTFCRLSLSNVFLPHKSCYNWLSTTLPLSKITVEEKLGIKPRPKRPKSSFLRFLSQIKPKIIEDNPKITIKDINRIAGEKWRNVDEKTKSQLSQEFKLDWIKYLDEVRAYDRTLSPFQKEEIQKANNTISENKKKKKLKLKMEQMGKPKKPPSTFVSFMQSKVHERGEISFKDWQLKIKKEWETAPASVKDQFLNDYQKEFEKYKIDMEKWEKKMKKEGYNELVRRSHS